MHIPSYVRKAYNRETEEQYTLLSNMGCRLFQGYYIARPMAEDAFEIFLKENGQA